MVLESKAGGRHITSSQPLARVCCWFGHKVIYGNSSETNSCISMHTFRWCSIYNFDTNKEYYTVSRRWVNVTIWTLPLKAFTRGCGVAWVFFYHSSSVDTLSRPTTRTCCTSWVCIQMQRGKCLYRVFYSSCYSSATQLPLSLSYQRKFVHVSKSTITWSDFLKRKRFVKSILITILNCSYTLISHICLVNYAVVNITKIELLLTVEPWLAFWFIWRNAISQSL